MKNKHELLKHVLSFLASLAIHAAVLYFLAVHFVSVKILDFNEKVTDIIIAPRPKLHAPKIDGPLPELPPSEVDLLFGIPSRRRPVQPVGIIEGGREDLIEHPEKATGGLAAEPKFSEGFRLDTRFETKASASENRFRLTIAERQPATSVTKPTIFSRPKAADLRKYIHPGFTGVSGFAERGGAGRRPRGTPSRVRLVSPNLLNIDLSPWARAAIETIDKNWNVPVLLTSSAEVTIEIAVVVLKSGEIVSLEVVSASENSDFNQAAREAIETSSPLPELPANFPASSLEVTLIFAKQ